MYYSKKINKKKCKKISKTFSSQKSFEFVYTMRLEKGVFLFFLALLKKEMHSLRLAVGKLGAVVHN